MPIISNFPGGSGSGGGGGLALGAVSDIKTLTASGKVYVKWTDPDDMVVGDATLAAWGGTVLVRKAGSTPTSRRDGTIVIDSKERNKYKGEYLCDSGLANGTQYFYKFFPYSTTGTYTNSGENEFSATPNAVQIGNVSGMSAVAAGNGKLNIKWTDPNATVESDSIALATWESTTVVVKAGGYATSPDDEDAEFTRKVTTRNEYATNALTVTGLQNGETYYISFFPATTDGAVNTNDANRITGVPNRLEITAEPSQKGTLTYNKNLQQPEWDNYDESQLSIGGQTSGIGANDYYAEFTPEDDYMWAGGSTEMKRIKWTINKAPGGVTVTPDAVTLDASNLTATVNVTKDSTGAVSAVSKDTSVATVEVAGTVLTIKHVDQTTGVANIEVTVAGDENYEDSEVKTVVVTAQFMPAKKDLNDMSWADISAVSEAGKASEYWEVGDRKAVELKGTVGTLALNTTLYVYILGFDHNSDKEGKGIHFGTFKTALTGGSDVCLVDSNYNSNKSDGTKTFNMNHWGGSSSPYNTNYGGWKGCDARYDILGSTKTQPSGYGSTPTTSRVGYDAPTDTATNPVPNTLMAALPEDLRAVMKPMTKYTDNYGNSSNVADHVTTSLDYLPLLAEWEIFGARTNANDYEKNYQVQYDYYKDSNSKVKNRHDQTGTAAYWWERSPIYNAAIYFCHVYTGGTAAGNTSRYSHGLAPAFKV